MRSVSWLLIGFVAIAAPASATAAAFPVPRAEAAGPADIIEVDRRCGRHHHWVPRHRTRDGRLIRGHCALNRHH